MLKSQTRKHLDIVLRLEKKQRAVKQEVLRARRELLKQIEFEVHAAVKNFNSLNKTLHRCSEHALVFFDPSGKVPKVVLEVSFSRKSDGRVVSNDGCEDDSPGVQEDRATLQKLLRQRLLGWDANIRLEYVPLEVDPPGFY